MAEEHNPKPAGVNTALRSQGVESVYLRVAGLQFVQR